jgi:hypothetical protein
MTFEVLSEQLRQRPFVPFRLYLTDGTTFEVRHPELFMLGRRAVVVGLPRHPDQNYFDRVTTIDLLHIMRTEPLLAPTPGNGEPSA